MKSGPSAMDPVSVNFMKPRGHFAVSDQKGFACLETTIYEIAGGGKGINNPMSRAVNDVR